jgi:hypothetical protein
MNNYSTNEQLQLESHSNALSTEMHKSMFCHIIQNRVTNDMFSPEFHSNKS